MSRHGAQVQQPGLFAEALLDQADVAVVATGRSGELRYVNGAAVRLFHWPRDVAELLGHRLPPLGTMGGRDRAVDPAGTALRGETWEGTVEVERSGSPPRRVRVYAAPLRHRSGAVDGAVIVARPAVVDDAPSAGNRADGMWTLRETLLPARPPMLDGLETGHRYVADEPRAAAPGASARVGAWYDVIPLAAGRVGIAVGDVVARGVGALAVSAQLRAAARAFAQEEHAPAEILRRLDAWCRSLTPRLRGTGRGDGAPPTAGCTYLVYDPWSRELSFAAAGQDGPLLVAGDEVRRLAVRGAGPLLGLGGGVDPPPAFREETVVLPAGATLLLHTGGAAARRTRLPIGEDMEVPGLREAVRAAAAAGDAATVAAAAGHVIPRDPGDDLLVVAVRTAPRPLPAVERVLPSRPVVVGEARRMARQTFAAWGMAGGPRDVACLLVSEVVTNAILHAAAGARGGVDGAVPDVDAVPPDGARPDGLIAPPAAGRSDRPARCGGGVALRLRRGAHAVWVEVVDADVRLPRIRTAGETDEGGRGLYLVEQLATRWGARPTRCGKAVWFEMPLDGDPR